MGERQKPPRMISRGLSRVENCGWICVVGLSEQRQSKWKAKISMLECK